MVFPWFFPRHLNIPTASAARRRNQQRPGGGCHATPRAAEATDQDVPLERLAATWQQWVRGEGYHLPFGKLSRNYGKSPFFMGKLTISMAIFNSKLINYQRVTIGKAWENPWENMVIS